MGERQTLTEELAELERTNSEVRAPAAERYDHAVWRLLFYARIKARKAAK